MAKAAKKSAKVGTRTAGAKGQAATRPGRGTQAPARRASGPARRSRSPVHPDILAYNAALAEGDRRICELLAQAIDRHLPGAESRIWHRHPVWFIEGNPIVGYHKLKDCVRLLFWSGRSFDEPGLPPEAGFQTAGVRYTAAEQISAVDLKRWLAKSVAIQWDYKNIVKRKGKLVRLK